MIKLTCPICERQVEGKDRSALPYFPFCSARCKTIDLGRWLDERYRMDADEQEDAREEKDIL
jgi:endogenous inhibitor of DNA gyrase (YacG/DUF329 family)